MRTEMITALKHAAIGIYILLAVLFICLFATRSEAKTVLYGSDYQTIRLAYGGPTILRFPKDVRTISRASRFEIRPANEADPSYSTLAVEPRFTTGTSDVVFILSDGSVVKVRLVVAPKGESAEAMYDFKTRETNDEAPEPESTQGSTETELLRAMLRDAPLGGYKVRKTSFSMPSKNSSIAVELIRVYEGSAITGYVYKLTNQSNRKEFNVDVRALTLGQPNSAILSQTDHSSLTPRGKGSHETLLRVVVKGSVSARQMIVPLEPSEPALSDAQGGK